MSWVDLALLPIRVGLGVADAVLHAVTPASPAAHCSGPTSSTTTTGPPAFPSTSRPAGWCRRAARTSTPPALRPATAPTFSVPPSGSPTPIRGGGSTGTRCWNTLLDPSVPIALFTFDTERAEAPTDQWPANAGVRSAGIDLALLISAAGARIIDLTTHASTPVEHSVDTASRSFLARLPRSLVEPAGTWTVRLASGLANDEGDGFAEVPFIRGALPRQRNVYNVAFRTHEQEAAHLNFWSDQAQADPHRRRRIRVFAARALGSACRSTHHRRARRQGHLDPVVRVVGRWGRELPETDVLSTAPQFLGRVQPYSVCLPATYAPGRKLPLRLLLHSLALGQNQFPAIDPRLLHQVCDDRDSVVVTPLARGPSCWYFDEGELDVWEVWARVAEQLGTDPNRTVVSATRWAATQPTNWG